MRTCASLKWKPPSENSIDFKLELQFPALQGSDQPDFSAMPVFSLLQWAGGDNYEYFDAMTVDQEEWEQYVQPRTGLASPCLTKAIPAHAFRRMKASKLQYDDAIVEVTWDMIRQSFRIMRIRDDKHHGNHKTIVTKIIESIKDGVEEEEVCTFPTYPAFSRVEALTTAYKLTSSLLTCPKYGRRGSSGSRSRPRSHPHPHHRQWAMTRSSTGSSRAPLS